MEVIVQLFLDHGLVVVLAVMVLALFRVLMDEDRTSLWRGRIFRAALSVTGRRDHEKKYIANDLKGRLNLARRKLFHIKGKMPVAVDVEWFDVKSWQAYEMRDGEYVVRLNPAAEQTANIVQLAEAMAQRTTLLGLRHLTAPGLQQAIDLTMVRKLLNAINSREALDHFLGAVYSPLRAMNEEFRSWDERIAEIDSQGLYERLLLVELEDFSRRIATLPPRPYLLGELEELVAFVHRIATKGEGEDVPLQYVKAHIRVGVVLVAKTGKLLREGIAPYLEAVRQHAREAGAIYVIIWHKDRLRGGFIWDQYNRFVNQLTRELRSITGLTHDFILSYRYTDPRGGAGQGVIARYICVDGERHSDRMPPR